jgi:NACHT domain
VRLTQRRWLAVAGYLAVLLGVPVAAFISFRREIFASPAAGAAVGLLYELAVLFGLLLTEIGRRFSARLAERVTDSLDILLSRKLSRFPRIYLRTLTAAHRHLDVWDLPGRGSEPVDLNEVFVEVALRPTSPDRAVAAAVPQPPDMAEPAFAAESTIWELLRSGAQRPRLLVLGAAGSGKTVLLKHIVLTLGDDRQRRRRGAPDLLPILVSLDRAVVEAILRDEKIPLADVVRIGLGALALQEPRGWLEAQLKGGRCLILIDGLDQVQSSEDRESIGRWIGAQFASNVDAAFIVTSRPLAERRAIPPAVRVVEIQPFTAEQIEQFIVAWFNRRDHRSSSAPREKRKAEQLFDHLHESPTLWALAGRPLFLLMLVSLSEDRYRTTGLPRHPVELYDEICRSLLARGTQATAGLRRDGRLHILGQLALQMSMARQLEVGGADATAAISTTLGKLGAQASPEAFLHDVATTSGLLTEHTRAGRSSWRFAHRTFQEFLTALALRDRVPNRARLLSWAGDPWWRETLRFYASVAGRAAVLVELCMDGDPPSVNALVLATECLEDSTPDIPTMVRTRLETLLAAESSHGDEQRQRILREVRLKLRIHRMARLGEASHISLTLLTNAEYQLFVDDSEARQDHRHLDHWRVRQHRSEEGAAPAVGIRASDALRLCEWLTERERDGRRFRLPRAGELSERQARRVVDACDGVPHWEELDPALTCLPKPDPRVAQEHLSWQLRFDVAQDLSRTMQQRIEPEHWRELLRLIPVEYPRPWLETLDPVCLAALDMQVPPSTLVALGVAVASGHDHKAANGVGGLLGVERDRLGAARKVVGMLSDYRIDTVHLDPDTILALAADLPRLCPNHGRTHRAALVVGAMAGYALDRAPPPEASWRAAKVLRWAGRLSALVLAVEARCLQDGSKHQIIDRPTTVPWSEVVDASLIAYAGLAMIDARAQGVTAVGSGLILVMEPTTNDSTSPVERAP